MPRRKIQEAFVNPYHLRILVVPYGKEAGDKFGVTITRGPHECSCPELYTSGPTLNNRDEAVQFTRDMLEMVCQCADPMVGATPVITFDFIEKVVAAVGRDGYARTYEPQFCSAALAASALAC